MTATSKTELKAEDLVLEILREAKVTESEHEWLAETGAIERAMRAAVKAVTATIDETPPLDARPKLAAFDDDDPPVPTNVVDLMGWLEAFSRERRPS
jgi:hypothetical protein